MEYGQRKLMSEFPNKNWKLSSLIKLLKMWSIVQQQVYLSRPRLPRGDLVW